MVAVEGVVRCRTCYRPLCRACSGYERSAPGQPCCPALLRRFAAPPDDMFRGYLLCLARDDLRFRGERRRSGRWR
jgi:hypothetical protein